MDYSVWTYSTQTVRPPPKLAHKRHIPGMLTSPQNDSQCPKLCCFSCSLITNTPWKYPFLAFLGPVKSPVQRFGIFYWCMHARTDSRLLFQKWSKLAQDMWLKIHVVLVTKTKHVLASLDATHGRFPPNFFCECTPWPLAYILGFIQIGPGLGENGDITEKTLHEPPEWMQYRLFKPIIIFT